MPNQPADLATYRMFLLLTAAAGFLFFIVSLREKKTGMLPALVGLPLCLGLGFAFGKIFYVMLLRAEDVLEWGEWKQFLDFQPKFFCLMGGAAGATLGAWLAAKICRKDAKTVLDAFAVPGALMIAGFRLAEIELDSIGRGRTLIDPKGFFSQAPFVLEGKWGQKVEAIFFWEALAALLVCFLALAEKENRAGMRFEKAVYRLCLCQILLESMLSKSMRWGFVRVEMVLSAALVLILVILACWRKHKGWIAIPATLLMIGVVGVLEYARQKASSAFLADYGYLLMGIGLAITGLIYYLTVREPETGTTEK